MMTHRTKTFTFSVLVTYSNGTERIDVQADLDPEALMLVAKALAAKAKRGSYRAVQSLTIEKVTRNVQ